MFPSLNAEFEAEDVVVPALPKDGRRLLRAPGHLLDELVLQQLVYGIIYGASLPDDKLLAPLHDGPEDGEERILRLPRTVSTEG